MMGELERVNAECEFYSKTVAELEEHNRVVTEAATKYSLWGQKAVAQVRYRKLDGESRAVRLP